jgi:hypothetical protein
MPVFVHEDDAGRFEGPHNLRNSMTVRSLVSLGPRDRIAVNASLLGQVSDCPIHETTRRS